MAQFRFRYKDRLCDVVDAPLDQSIRETFFRTQYEWFQKVIIGHVDVVFGYGRVCDDGMKTPRDMELSELCDVDVELYPVNLQIELPGHQIHYAQMHYQEPQLSCSDPHKPHHIMYFPTRSFYQYSDDYKFQIAQYSPVMKELNSREQYCKVHCPKDFCHLGEIITMCKDGLMYSHTTFFEMKMVKEFNFFKDVKEKLTVHWTLYGYYNGILFAEAFMDDMFVAGHFKQLYQDFPYILPVHIFEARRLLWIKFLQKYFGVGYVKNRIDSLQEFNKNIPELFGKDQLIDIDPSFARRLRGQPCHTIFTNPDKDFAYFHDVDTIPKRVEKDWDEWRIMVEKYEASQIE